MATSGSTDFALTSRQVCADALHLCGVTPQGETPGADESTEALLHLNLCLKTWTVESGLWLTTEGGPVPLVAASAAYSVPAARRVSSVRRRTSNIDLPLIADSRSTFYDRPNKSATGSPLNFYFDPQRSTRTLNIWPVPDSTVAANTTLYYTYQRVIEDSDSLDNDPDVPQEWLEALTYSLAERLCVAFKVFVSDPTTATEIKGRAGALYAQLTADSDEDTSMFMQPQFS